MNQSLLEFIDLFRLAMLKVVEATIFLGEQVLILLATLGEYVLTHPELLVATSIPPTIILFLILKKPEVRE